jgi:hypothetical protein
VISDESDRFNPRDPKPADAGKPSKSAKRREARQLATQALYQWHMAKHSLNEIEAQFRVDNDFTDVDGAYFREILHGVPAVQDRNRHRAQALPGPRPSKSSTRLNWRFCACPPGNCSSASTCRTAW